jgi:hypothetical protein
MWEWLVGLRWGNIGTAVAAVAAAGALAVALLERRARIRSSYSSFTIRDTGLSVDPGDGQPATPFEFVHHGAGNATIVGYLMLSGATVYSTDEGRLPEVMTPGQRVTVFLRSGDFERAFCLFTWIDDRRRPARMAWLPLSEFGPYAQRLTRQLVHQRAFAVLSRLRLGVRREVGPYGICAVRLSRRAKARGRRVRRWMPDDMSPVR